MKKLFIAVCSILFCFSNTAQIQFNQRIISKELFQVAGDICSADIDNDNDMDIILTSHLDNKISWFENLGNTNWGEQHILCDSIDDPIQVKAIDIDNDGDLDIVSAFSSSSKILWFKNDGVCNFSYEIVDSNFNSPLSIHCVDIDYDGDTDIISSSFAGNKVVWYENLGGGSFGTVQIISTNVINPSEVYAADLDGDQLIDILSSSVGDHKLAWYRNLGSNGFGSQIIISQAVISPRNIIVSDIDGDGDNDVFCSSFSTYETFCFKNDSTGSFGSMQSFPPSTKSKSILVCDVDDDEDDDLFTPSHMYFNNGSGIFGYQTMIDSFIYLATSADFDNDGDIDLAGIFGNSNLAWYSNDGTGNFSERNIISSGIKGPHQFAYSDIDNDGLSDIVVSAVDNLCNISLFKNFGNGSYLATDTLGVDIYSVLDFYVRDIDGDSLKDVIAFISFNGPKVIAWYRQDSIGMFGELQIIVDSIQDGRDFFISDLDGDGDNDILLGAMISGYPLLEHELYMWLNDGTGNFSNKIIVNQGYKYIKSIKSFDLNNDSLMDIIYAADYVRWGKNLGNGNGFQFYGIGNTSWDASAVNAADLDGDNDLDVVYACNSLNPLYGSHISWLENDGTGSFTSSTQTFSTLYTDEIILKDMDKDGDIDIISEHSSSQNSLYWLENDGLGNFIYTSAGYMQVIDDSITVTSIVVDDLDGDGDNDVLYNSQPDGLIAWAENKGYRSYDSATVCSNEPYFFGNQIITSPGDYTETMQTIYGLDSLVDLNLSHIPAPTVSLAPFPQDTFCIQTQTIDFPLGTPLGGEYFGAGVVATNINLQLADTGTHQLTYQYTDTTTGCSDIDTIQFVVIDCLTIPEAEQLGVKVYPNPARGFVNIELEHQLGVNQTTLSIFDATGKVLTRENANAFPYRLSLESLNPGLYYLQIYNGETTAVYKVVKR